MESQLQRPQQGHQRYEEDPQNVGLHSVIEGERHEGEHHDHHGEKKSVLNKVKDKAKKIKDTIKKHGHGHEHGDGHGHEGGEDNCQQAYEEDEEDYEKEEMVNDPKVHGAPKYESSVIRMTDLPRDTHVHLEKPTDTRGDIHDHNERNEAMSKPLATTLPTCQHAIDRGRQNVDEIGPPMGLEDDLHFPKNSPAQIPPSNYQPKVTDPTGAGGKEAGVAPLVHQFDNLNVHDASASKPDSEEMSSTELNPKGEDPVESEDVPQDTIAGKISSATSAIADKAVSAKNVVASKMGYGGGLEEGSKDSSKKPALESATEYVKVAEKLTPVYDKVAGAGAAVMSKVQGQGNGGAEHQDGDRGVPMGEYLAEKFKPGDEDKALSEVITNTLHQKKEAMWRTGEEQEQQQQVGKVTESEEVTARLGPPADSKREGEDALASGAESSGQGFADRMKDAVSLWLGKSTGVQTAQESVRRSHVSDAGSGSG